MGSNAYTKSYSLTYFDSNGYVLLPMYDVVFPI